MSLPYPGRYESHDHWMRRCDEWERQRDERRRSQASRSWTSGQPNKSGVERPVTPVAYALPDGQIVSAVAFAFGSKASGRLARWAEKHGCQCLRYIGNGCHGKYARHDAVAYKATGEVVTL